MGDGAAGMTAARTLRGLDPAADITVLSDDPNPAYFRAALTNYLLGELREEQIWATPASFYEQYRLTRLHARAIGLDAARAQIHSSHSAVPLSYDGLLLCSGARARAPEFEGRHLRGVMTLRTLQDCRAVMELVTSGRIRHAAVVGGGPLALEWALGMHARGVRVTVLLRGTAFMQGALDAVGSDLVAARLRQAGVQVVAGDQVALARDRADGSVGAIRTERGQELPCDLLACAIGVIPNSEWLASSGMRFGASGAVVVDERGRTSLPGVYAAGDLVEVFGRTLQLWEPAQTVARVAARNLAGVPDAYAPGVHYMATRLFDLDFASLGEVSPTSGAEELSVLPRGTGTISYQKVVLRGPLLVGALLLGQREARVRQRGRLYKRLIDARTDVSAVKKHLLDPDFDLGAWAERNTLRRDAVSENRNVAAGAQLRGTAVFDLNELGKLRGKPSDTALPAPSRAGTEVLASLTAPGESSSSGVDIAAATQALGTQVLNAFNPRPATPPPATAASPVRPAFLLTANARIPLVGTVVRIGRDPASTVPLPDPLVDTIHAHLELSGGQWYLRDLGSQNGTWLDGDSVDVPKRMHSGNRIVLGQSELVFVYEGDEGKLAAEEPGARQAGTPAPRLVVRSGRALGLTFVLERSPTLIGSDPSSGLWLSDPGVKSEHAHLERHSGRWRVVARVPGTEVNGVPLAPGHGAELQEKHRLRIGGVELAFSETPLRSEPVASAPARPSTGERARLQAFAAVATPGQGVAPRLRVEAGSELGQAAWLDEVLLAGRSPECQLRLSDPALLPVHLELRKHGGGYWVRAFGPCSKGDAPLTGEYVPLQLGDRLTLGRSTLLFEEVSR